MMVVSSSILVIELYQQYKKFPLKGFLNWLYHELGIHDKTLKRVFMLSTFNLFAFFILTFHLLRKMMLGVFQTATIQKMLSLIRNKWLIRYIGLNKKNRGIPFFILEIISIYRYPNAKCPFFCCVDINVVLWPLITNLCQMSML